MAPEKWLDLGLNLFSEVVGILVTVFLVDRILKSREEARWKTSKNLIYSKLFEISSNILNKLLPSSWRSQLDYAFYEFDGVQSELVLDIPEEDWSKGQSRYDITKYLGKMDSKEWLEILESLSNAREQLSRVNNDSGFFLDPELLSLVLPLVHALDAFTHRYSALKALGRKGYGYSTDKDIVDLNALSVLFAIKNLQTWLVAHSTKKTALKELVHDLQVE